MCLGYNEELQKKKLSKRENQRKTYLRFQLEHPQYTTHCLKKVTSTEKERVPVLKGFQVPRSDEEEKQVEYAVSMMALFKPWSRMAERILKNADEGWVNAYVVVKSLFL